RRSAQVRGQDHVSGGHPARRQRRRAVRRDGQGDLDVLEERAGDRRRGRLRAADGEPGRARPGADRLEEPMKRALSLLAISLFVASCATVHTRGRYLATRALTAAGGADKLAAVRTVSVRATVKQWE